MPTRAAALKHAFDGTFAGLRRGERLVLNDLLALQLGADPYAIRLSQTAGLFARTAITALPSRMPGLIGIAGVRGVLVPVYDLGMLLGYAPTATPRWLVIAAAAPMGFAFDGFDGHLRLPNAEIAAQEREDGHSSRPYVREVARAPDRVLPIVHLPLVVEAIIRAMPSETVGKER